MGVKELDRAAENQDPQVDHEKEESTISFLQGHTENSHSTHVEQNVGNSLMTKRRSDDSVVLIGTYDGLVIEAKVQGCRHLVVKCQFLNNKDHCAQNYDEPGK